MMTKWDYQIIEVKPGQEKKTIEALLDEQGKDGWECFSIRDERNEKAELVVRYYFKRAL